MSKSQFNENLLCIAAIACVSLLGCLLISCSAKPSTTVQRGNWIRVTSTLPTSPARLKAGERFTVRFAYGLTNEAGALIMVYPYTNGGRTPDHSSHGSPKYDPGSGDGFGSFGALKLPLAVDEVRIEMKEFGTARLLATTNLAVDVRWE